MTTISPSEAVHGFATWLLSRPESSGPFSRESDPLEASALAEEFCFLQDWDAPQDGWDLKFDLGRPARLPEEPEVLLPVHTPEKVASYFFEHGGKPRTGLLMALLERLAATGKAPEDVVDTMKQELLRLDEVLRSAAALAPEVSSLIARRLSAKSAAAPPGPGALTVSGKGESEAKAFQQRIAAWVGDHWRGHRPLEMGARTCPLCSSSRWIPSPQSVHLAAENALLLANGFAYLSCMSCGYTLLFNLALMKPPAPEESA